jgi:HEAT repeat protein
VLLDRADPRTAAAAAEALEAIGDPKAEPRLLDAVRHEAAELRIAAARALGVVGTVNAVEPLLHELDTKRLDGESRRALREAVSAIQSRLAGAEAGQLSLAATTAEAGRLSLATPRAGPGDVSLAAKPDR